MSTSCLWRLLLPLVFSPWLSQAQPAPLYFPTDSQAMAINLFVDTPLYQEPGQTATRLGSLPAGAELLLTGEGAYLKDERHSYVKIRTAQGEVGWVNENFLEKHAGMAEVITTARIYARPRTETSITLQSFEAGEQVVLLDFQGEWVHLMTLDRSRTGWIQGLDKVEVIENGAAPATSRVATSRSQAPASVSAPALSPLLAAQPLPPGGSFSASLVDPKSGERFTHVVATGSVLPVESSGGLLEAAHATLPAGTYLRLALPGDQGFVALRVTSLLPKGSDALIGLSQQTMQALFGRPWEPQVTISYFQP